MPQIAGPSAGAPSGQADLLSMLGGGGGGGGPTSPDQQQAQAEEQMGKLRELDQAAQALGAAIPTVQQEVQQIRQIVKRMVIKVGQMLPASTGSAQALPMGG